MRHALLCILLLCSGVSAQTPTRLSSTAQVAAELSRARSVVLISVPTVSSVEIADALRLAVLRGVQVRLLVDDRYTEDPDVYTPGLDALQWAFSGSPTDPERVAPYNPERFMIRTRLDVPSFALIDAEVVVQGPLVERGNLPFDAGKTYALRDPTVHARRLSEFINLWSGGVGYQSLTTRYFTIE